MKRLSGTWHEQLKAAALALANRRLDELDIDLRGLIPAPPPVPRPAPGPPIPRALPGFAVESPEFGMPHLKRVLARYRAHEERESAWRPIESEAEPGKFVCGSYAPAWWNAGDEHPPGPEPRCRRLHPHHGRQCTDGIWHWDHPRTPPHERRDVVLERERQDAEFRAVGRALQAAEDLRSLGWTVVPPDRPVPGAAGSRRRR